MCVLYKQHWILHLKLLNMNTITLKLHNIVLIVFSIKFNEITAFQEWCQKKPLNYCCFDALLIIWGSRLLFITALPVSKLALQRCAVAALASGLTLSCLARHTLATPLPLGGSTPAFTATAPALMLMQSERPLALIWHPRSAPLLRSVSNLLALHSICLARGPEL